MDYYLFPYEFELVVTINRPIQFRNHVVPFSVLPEFEVLFGSKQAPNIIRVNQFIELFDEEFGLLNALLRNGFYDSVPENE